MICINCGGEITSTQDWNRSGGGLIHLKKDDCNYYIGRPSETVINNDPINKPIGYNSHPSGVECITITRHMNFNIGNVMKYCWRAGLKPNTSIIEDLKKAQWYLSDEIKRLEKEK